MSHILNKFLEGEVHIKDKACGWLFDDGEFRPLMADAMKQLRDAGYVSDQMVEATAQARDVYVVETLTAYIEREKDRQPSGEEMFEMRAAFGRGATVVNAITGCKVKL